jgi:orotidine-5'-phosphate decarboxylase
MSNPSAVTNLLSTKPIPAAERLIFALDVATPEEARRLVETLDDAVLFYKVGLELFLSGGSFDLVDWLVERGKKVFVDLKLFDVPETVRKAMRQLASRPITLTTVHGNDRLLEAAVSAKGAVQVLAVTVLTSLDQGDLEDLGFAVDVHRLVLSRAKRALALGCDGVVSSGLEARALREELGDKLLVVTPGIRPVENRPADDQKRVVTVEEAFGNGADYIVVGRPIQNAPDPRQAALGIQASIARIFG